MFSDGMIHNSLEWILVVLFALGLCTIGGIIIGCAIDLFDRILSKGRREIK